MKNIQGFETGGVMQMVLFALNKYKKEKLTADQNKKNRPNCLTTD